MDLLRSLPIGLYLEQPVTWLHQLDPRVKLAWLISFMLTPIGASPAWRLSIVGWLILLTLSTLLPFRTWRRQMGIVLILSLLLFFVTMLAPDGINVPQQPRLPANELAIAPPEAGTATAPEADLTNSAEELPQPTDYQYVLFERGIIRITRRSVELAIRLGSLVFTLIYSANLYLMTTAPEEITAGLDNLLAPLRRFNLPITEIVLTLTLALRFIPLVLEEVQNLVRSVRTRAINWKKLGFRGTAQVWTMIAERLIDNLLVRAEQIASAMQVRGFTSPNQHQVQWHQFRLRLRDWITLAGVGVFWSARFLVGA
ncbi:energy-coupling factor transporter transmembrane component T family protein [Egbenema bharatensis]|uniref:energy-coupling factor transporter transmembrane component T family protein n=1 Tax=Egbenema bharatensis TaxID=3463334 RepID=UPI003A8560A6